MGSTPVRKDLPVNTMAEFIEYAKKADKPLAFGSTGVGSLYHLMAEDAAKIGGLKHCMRLTTAWLPTSKI